MTELSRLVDRRVVHVESVEDKVERGQIFFSFPPSLGIPSMFHTQLSTGVSKRDTSKVAVQSDSVSPHSYKHDSQIWKASGKHSVLQSFALSFLRLFINILSNAAVSDQVLHKCKSTDKIIFLCTLFNIQTEPKDEIFWNPLRHEFSDDSLSPSLSCCSHFGA
jgi:hypothetical protein